MSLQNQTIKEEDSNFIQQHITKYWIHYGEEIINQQWFLVIEIKNEKSYKKKGDKKIIVLGKHRIYLFKLTMFKKKLQFERDWHLYSLKQISNKIPELVELAFEDGNKIGITTSMALDYIKRIKDSILKISIDFDPSLIPTLHIDQERWRSFDSPPQIEVKPCNNLAEIYLAKSNYYKAPIHYGFLEWIKDQNNKQNTTPNLSYMPGIESGQSEVHLVSLMTSLASNTFFEAFILYDLPRRDLFSSIALMLRYNNTITKFVASKLGNSSKIGDIGPALTQNKDHQISMFDISYNNISGGDFFQIIDCFDNYPHGLTVLNLSNCNLGQKSIIELFSSFRRNFAMSLTIEELILDKNSFGTKGSEAFATWLQQVQDLSPLRKLSMKSCGVAMDLIFQNFKLQQIEFLNISDNSFTEKIGNSEFYKFLRDVGTLQELRISKCGLNGEIAAQIFQCLLANEKINGIIINASKNKIGSGKKQMEVFKNMFKTFTNKKTFDELKLTDNGFSSENLNDVIQTLLSNNYSIKKLEVGDDHLYKHAFPIEQSISNITNTSGNLRYFSLRGKYLNVTKFLCLIGLNQTLTHLDLRKLKLGDVGISELALNIRKNTVLRYLNVDENETGMNGFYALHDAFEINQTVWHFEYPKKDIQALESSLKTIERRRNLQKLFFSLFNFISRNQNNSGGQYLPELYEKVRYDNYVQVPTVPVKPLAHVPEHLTMLNIPEKGKFEEEDVQNENKDRLIEPTLTTPRNRNSISPYANTHPSNNQNNEIHIEQNNYNNNNHYNDNSYNTNSYNNNTNNNDLNHHALENVSSLLQEIDNHDHYGEEEDYDTPPPIPTFDVPLGNQPFPPTIRLPPSQNNNNLPPPVKNNPPPPKPPTSQFNPPPPKPTKNLPPKPVSKNPGLELALSMGGSMGPPPPPPPPPEISISEIDKKTDKGRGDLLSSIQKGKKLKKTVTVDKSGPLL
eukprot:TRINITY_DN3446_c0_g1_i1.p1 TRINITY_DN3446_c0_g1~~TRINITY_DN3446_c0_g1_i1.p1  ORF type:complete len:961 (-),score=308.32 TRINITY_DN3446_c0_g1_i1:40-2922(-)